MPGVEFEVDEKAKASILLDLQKIAGDSLSLTFVIGHMHPETKQIMAGQYKISLAEINAVFDEIILQEAN